MTLKDHIDDIRNRLKEGGYISEAAISNQIVIRLLNKLGWTIFDEWAVIFEYPVGNDKKVDLALCCPRAKPVIFIEIKAFERFLEKYMVENTKKQLSEYISYFQNNSGEEIPIAILIDGQKWLFFHSTGEGDWKETLVCELDFIGSETEEIAECLNRYLNYNSVRTGEAIQAIKDDYLKGGRLIPKDKDSPGRLRVTMPDGEVIDCQDSEKTFVKVIKKLGLEKVARSRPKIVKKSPYEHNGFYINTCQPLKWEKRNILVSIGRQLGKLLKVERIEK